MDTTDNLAEVSRDELKALIAGVNRNQRSAPLSERDTDRGFELSPAQQGVWLIAQDPVASAAYNIRLALEIRGALEPERLESAFNRLIQRHNVLRTAYRYDDETQQPLQYVLAERTLKLTPKDDSYNHWLASLDNLSPVAFYLSRGEVISAQLNRFNADHWGLVLDLHHIACDGWSIGVLLNELRHFYLNPGQPLSPLTLDYIGYHQQRDEKQIARSLAWWRKNLADAPQTTIPPHRRQTKADRWQGGCVEMALGRQLSDELERCAGQHQMSAFMLFAAGLQYLLGRYNDRQDVVIGSYSAGREGRESEPLIGCFINNLVLRNRWDEHQTVNDYLRQSRDRIVEAFTHQQAPFADIVKTLGSQGEGHPLYQVGLVIQQEWGDLDGWEELQIKAHSPGSSLAHMDLEIYVWPGDQGYRLVFNYAASRYSAARIERMAEHLRLVLQQLCSAQEKPLAALQLLTAQEQQVHQQLQPTATLPAAAQWMDALLHQLTNSTDVALEQGDQRYDYPALAARVAQWQQALNQNGCTTGQRIAFAGRRGLDQVAAMLAIWLNRACYVPLDATLPETRVNTILDDAEVALILTDGSVAPWLAKTSVPLLTLSAEISGGLANPLHTAAPIAEEAEFALLYTSGSTGAPKGVRISWDAATARLAWGREAYPTDTEDRVLQRTSLNFVDSLWEVLETLLAGARLVVAETDTVKDGRALARLVAGRRISRAYVVPGMLQLLTTQWSEPLPTMRLMLSSAERVSPALLSAVQRLMPHSRVINLYGSTEVNDVAACPLTAQAATSNRIGTPMSYARISILDSLQRPMPLDCPGLLYVGGDHLPLGYTNQQIAWLDDQHGRLFPMNDRAILREEGAIDLCGRVDDLVKVRGHRVELAEVRLQLTAAAEDPRAVALALENDQGEVLLAGVWQNNTPAGQVRQRMLKQLPEYMVPQRLCALQTIPLLHSGKPDMHALRELLMNQPQVDVSALPDSARPLAEIWCELLGCDSVALQDSFFELGGHSLLVARLAARIRRQFKRDVEMATLFRLPLLQDQLDWLAGLSGTEEKDEPGFDAQPERSAYPLSSPQQRIWFLQQFNQGQTVGYNMCYGLRLDGAIDPARLSEALNLLVNRHGVLRTIFVEQPDENQISQPVQKLQRHAFISLQYSTVEGDQSLTEALQQTVDEAQREPFALDRAPLMRCALLEKAPDRFGLMLSVHHIIADGWTMGLLVQDLCDFYNGRPVIDNTRLYVDYTLWQQQRLAQSERKTRLDQFWRHYLADSPRLTLPLDEPRHSDALGPAQLLTATLSADALRRLRGKTQSPRLYDALLARFAAALRLWGAGDDLLIGMVTANRHLDPALEQIAGFFSNTLPVRIQLDSAGSLADLHQRTQQSVDRAMAHQEQPYDRIVRQNSEQRHGMQAPLLQALCILQNTPDIPFRLGDVEAELLPLRSVEAKFELTLQCYESDAGLELLLEFASELINPERARKLLNLILSQLQLDYDAVLSAPAQQATTPAWTRGESLTLPADLPEQLPDALLRAARRYPEKGLRFIEADGDEHWLSYAELHRRACRLAAGLQQGEVWSLAGRPVIVLSDALQPYVENFWAVMLAGGVPVTVAAADSYDDPSSGERLLSVWRHLEQPVVICDEVCAEKLPPLQQQHPRMEVVVPAALTPTADYLPWRHEPDGLAILQLSSGSTGAPKCIQQSHRAIISYSALCAHSRDYRQEHISLNWISFDHVAALLFTHLRDVCLGREQIHLATRWVLEDPLRWPLSMARFGVTHSWSPNFGYKLITAAARQQPERRADLSTVEELINAGEMVVVDTLRDLNETFQSWQLSPRAMAPAFGMAECCTIIVGHLAQDPVHSALSSEQITLDAEQSQLGMSQFVALGGVMAETEIRIVDDENRLLQEYQVGRMQIRGCTVTSGYYGAEAATGKALLGDGWFDSGDLGLLADGELYLTGRSQEMIVLNGVNYFCHELEACAEQVAGVKPTWVAAVGYQQGEQEAAALFMVAEAGTETEVLIEAVRNRLASHMQFYPSHLEVLTEAEFPKTVSGKIQRRQLAARMVKAGREDASVALRKLSWKTLAERPAGRWGSYDDPSQWAAGEGLLIPVQDGEEATLLTLRDTLIALPEQWQGPVILCCAESVASQLHAWVTTLSQEYPGQTLAVVVADEVRARQFPAGEATGLYRWHPDGWQQQSEQVCTLPASDNSEPARQPSGYALVTGATGGIARELIPHLCKQGQRLVLLSRRPAETEFAAELESNWPGQCHWLQSEISDSETLRRHWQRLQEQDTRFGSAPDAIYHLAGNFNNQPIQELTAESLFEARVPRAYMVTALEALIESLSPASPCRWFHFSSLNGWRGGASMASYNSACGELRDTAARQREQGKNSWWLGWSAWKDTGMSRGNFDPQRLRSAGLQLLTPELALGALDAIDKAPPGDYLLGAGEPPKARSSGRRLPETLPAALPDALCLLVAHILDIGDCDPEANFFDQGGSSLELIQLQRLMQQRLQRSVDITTLLQYPSVARLCAHLEDQGNNQQPERRGRRKTHQRRTARARK